MKALPFAKVIPGGNPTIILPAMLVDNHTLPALSQSLMGSNNIQAEQVGSLSLPPAGEALPHLQMMGGEFCVNATRACAALLANAGQLQRSPSQCQIGYMTVSGVDTPVLVATAPTAPLLQQMITTLGSISKKTPDTAPFNDCNIPNTLGTPSTLATPSTLDTLSSPLEGQCTQGCLHPSVPPTVFPPDFSPCTAPMTGWISSITVPFLHTAARLTSPITDNTIISLEKNMALINLPGISHLLIPATADTMPSPHHCEALAQTYRSAYGLEAFPASGTIWYEEHADSYAILPAVYVKATDSLCVETACGSASLALALRMHSNKGVSHKESATYTITQPSGEDLLVTIEPSYMRNGVSYHPIWVAGSTHIVAIGSTYTTT